MNDVRSVFFRGADETRLVDTEYPVLEQPCRLKGLVFFSQGYLEGLNANMNASILTDGEGGPERYKFACGRYYTGAAPIMFDRIYIRFDVGIWIQCNDVDPVRLALHTFYYE